MPKIIINNIYTKIQKVSVDVVTSERRVREDFAKSSSIITGNAHTTLTSKTIMRSKLTLFDTGEMLR